MRIKCKGLKPICELGKYLVAYKDGCYYAFSDEDYAEIAVPSSITRSIPHSRLFVLFKRLEPRAAIAIDDVSFLVSIMGRFEVINVQDGNAVEIYGIKDSKALYF